MEYYNREKLIKVSVFDFFPSRLYRVKKEKKIMGFIYQKGGVYWIGDLVKLPENHTIIDENVYENPEVRLYFENGYTKSYFFKTNNEAISFRDSIINTGTWIK